MSDAPEIPAEVEVPEAETEPQRGRPDGDHTTEDKDGNVATAFTLVKGKVHGEYRRYEAGSLVQRAHFVNGVLNGPTETFAEGVRVQRAPYLNGVLQGDLEIYAEDGETVAQRFPYVEGKKHGRAELYDKGRLQVQIEYADDRQHGPLVTYSPTKRPMARLHFSEGKKHGPAIYYDPDGNPVKRETYEDGKLHGPASDLLPSGAVIKTMTYEEDLLTGDVMEYDHKGRETFRQRFMEGEPAGPKQEKTRFGWKDVDAKADEEEEA